MGGFPFFIIRYLVEQDMNENIQENKMCSLPDFLFGTLPITSKAKVSQNRFITIYSVCNFCYTDCDTRVAGCTVVVRSWYGRGTVVVRSWDSAEENVALRNVWSIAD